MADGQAAKSFFEGILPEGSMRKSLSAAFHANGNDIFAFVERLNNESAGALVFKLPGEDPEEGRGYAAFDEGDFERFADAPRSFAPHVISRSRLSLAGASRIGFTKKTFSKHHRAFSTSMNRPMATMPAIARI